MNTIYLVQYQNYVEEYTGTLASFFSREEADKYASSHNSDSRLTKEQNDNHDHFPAFVTEIPISGQNKDSVIVNVHTAEAASRFLGNDRCLSLNISQAVSDEVQKNAEEYVKQSMNETVINELNNRIRADLAVELSDGSYSWNNEIHTIKDDVIKKACKSVAKTLENHATTVVADFLATDKVKEIVEAKIEDMTKGEMDNYLDTRIGKILAKVLKRRDPHQEAFESIHGRPGADVGFRENQGR